MNVYILLIAKFFASLLHLQLMCTCVSCAKLYKRAIIIAYARTIALKQCCSRAVLEKSSGGAPSLAHRDHTPCCCTYVRTDRKYVGVVISVVRVFC